MSYQPKRTARRSARGRNGSGDSGEAGHLPSARQRPGRARAVPPHAAWEHGTQPQKAKGKKKKMSRTGVNPNRVARPFGAPSSGFPADFGPWTAVHFGACEDHSVVISSFGKEVRREFLYSIQHRNGQHYGKQECELPTLICPSIVSEPRGIHRMARTAICRRVLASH